jgi:restriction system protein
METEQKREELLQLAWRRQADRLEPHYCLADFHNGYYECDHVSPWTISACNVDAEIMLIAQDWASSEILEGERVPDRKEKGQDSWRRSNKNLKDFLELIGLQFSDTYATNAFPFIKHGAMNRSIPSEHMANCVRIYTLPEIEIVSPRMAICLGKATFKAVCRAAELGDIEWLTKSARPGAHIPRIGYTEIYGMPHMGDQGVNNAGGKDVVGRMWKRLGNHLQCLRNGGYRGF